MKNTFLKAGAAAHYFSKVFAVEVQGPMFCPQGLQLAWCQVLLSSVLGGLGQEDPGNFGQKLFQ